jgi:hypothetical protein
MTGHDTRLHERCIRSIRFTGIIVVYMVIRYFPLEQKRTEKKKKKKIKRANSSDEMMSAACGHRGKTTDGRGASGISHARLLVRPGKRTRKHKE